MFLPCFQRRCHVLSATSAEIDLNVPHLDENTTHNTTPAGPQCLAYKESGTASNGFHEVFTSLDGPAQLQGDACACLDLERAARAQNQF